MFLFSRMAWSLHPCSAYKRESRLLICPGFGASSCKAMIINAMLPIAALIRNFAGLLLRNLQFPIQFLSILLPASWIPSKTAHLSMQSRNLFLANRLASRPAKCPGLPGKNGKPWQPHQNRQQQKTIWFTIASTQENTKGKHKTILIVNLLHFDTVVLTASGIHSPILARFSNFADSRLPCK